MVESDEPYPFLFNASKSEKQMERLDKNSIMKQLNRKVEYFRGCLLGGAIGDALGFAVDPNRGGRRFYEDGLY